MTTLLLGSNYIVNCLINWYKLFYSNLKLIELRYETFGLHLFLGVFAMTSTLFNNFYIVDVQQCRQALHNHLRFFTAPKKVETHIKLQSNPENLISKCHCSFITQYSTTSKSIFAKVKIVGV